MTFFQKLFAGRGHDAYQEGVALYEQGRVAEAIPLLEPLFVRDPSSPRGSLAGLYLRQAMVGEGKRLLQTGTLEPAAELLERATRHWPDFPDLQFLAGAAQGLAGQWGRALEAAKLALRRNPDYAEARLLEICALQQLQRPAEAEASYQALCEAGRRVDSGLLRDLANDQGRAPSQLPPDLVELLRRAVHGDDIKHHLAEAVALCRSGDWDQGLAALARLGKQFPRYPDIRAKHAAALYQAGRSPDALLEAEAALALNPRYRTAVSLKGLILAEQGDVLAAHAFLAEAVPRLEGMAGRHEELFLAYLRAALALLLGDFVTCRRLLAGWHDLPRQFARAELLLVACDDLTGCGDAALRRLEELITIWPADAELHFLRLAILLQQRQWSTTATLLTQWPGGRRGLEDPRPLYLRGRLEVAQGREPVLPAAAPEVDQTSTDDELLATVAIAPAAWRQLAIHAALLRGETGEAWHLAQAQLESGQADEETGRLLLAAAAGTGDEPPADLVARCGIPDSWALERCRQLRLQHRGPAAEALADRGRSVRPDRACWSWLAASFWFDPVRRWLG